MMPIAIIAVGVVLIAGFVIWRFWFETYHFATVHEGALYRDGNRGSREFATIIRRLKPKTIIVLVDDVELEDRDKPEFRTAIELARKLGIPIERVPIKLGGWPTTNDVRRFLEIAGDKRKQPILMHCAQGVRRTGMMAATYQATILGYDKQRIQKEILTFGHSERTIGDVRRFIEVYDPIKREVTRSPERVMFNSRTVRMKPFMAEKKGKGFLGWLGRQVGYVTKAVKTEVPAPPKKVFERRTTEEAPHPANPGIMLRRTIIDEAIKDPAAPSSK